MTSHTKIMLGVIGFWIALITVIIGTWKFPFVLGFIFVSIVFIAVVGVVSTYVYDIIKIIFFENDERGTKRVR